MEKKEAPKKESDRTALLEIHCPFCRAIFKRSEKREKKAPLLFCAYCGTKFKHRAPSKKNKSFFTISSHTPKEEEIQGSIGQYLLLSSIAKGGMGEVFLAFDTVSGRRVALKRIRPDFASTPLLRQRFLKEARITSQLIHPSIIPIYNIHIEEEVIYYTMPFVEGKTLRTLLKEAYLAENDTHHTSITALTRIFLSIVQAIAYAHSKGVLHRDIKPENIILGPYGQVIILDWGLTKPIEEKEESLPELDSDTVHTKLGKIVGTVAYMAPERASGKPSSIATDIYSLGVILYQILTLTLPFKRKNIPSFIEGVAKEHLVAPEIRAPYRDVPKALSELTKRCLEADPTKRIQNCDEIVEHIENYLEGKSEWFVAASLHVDAPKDWQIQENILFSHSTSPLKRHENSDWYRLMISSQFFTDTVRLSLSVTLHKDSQGIGLFFAVPDEKERRALTDGYCLWLPTQKETEQSTMLLRSSVLVAEAPNVTLSPDTPHKIVIEKTNESITLFIDGAQVFSHVSHIPVVGPHVGLLIKDSLSSISPLEVATGSQNITVNCLRVPDAFLSAHAYDKAFFSYSKLADLFPGRAEEREALFRAGIALLEKAKVTSDPSERDILFNQALLQFETLRNTSGAPLEYLGKSFIYQATREYVEEAKCFEIAFRRYQDHPLVRVLHEQLLVRLHESLKSHRLAASYFIALALRFMPQEITLPSTKKLLADIKTEWEWPHYFPEKSSDSKEYMLLGLSFWLTLPHIALERLALFLATPVLPKQLIETALLTIHMLQNEAIKEQAIQKCRDALSVDEIKFYEPLLELLQSSSEESVQSWINALQKTDDLHSRSVRVLIVLLDHMLEQGLPISTTLLEKLYTNCPSIPALQARVLELMLREHRYHETESIFSHAHINEKSPLFFLKGCFLAKQKGEKEALEYFASAKECLYPPYWNVAAYALTSKIALRNKGWILRAYPYEISTLERHLKLFSSLPIKAHLS